MSSKQLPKLFVSGCSRKGSGHTTEPAYARRSRIEGCGFIQSSMQGSEMEGTGCISQVNVTEIGIAVGWWLITEEVME